jgi:hypothetical protein
MMQEHQDSSGSSFILHLSLFQLGTVLSRLRPYALLAVLALFFFADLLWHPTQVLYSDHSDLLEETLPTKRFLVRSWQETGEVPLWCPYSYAGMPFVHDVKVAAFYPLYLPLYLLPETALGAALSWLVVLHVIIAGWCMYSYAAFQGLKPRGAWVAAVGYMFAGKWILHLLAAGHSFMAPLAWLPLVCLGLEAAQQRRSLLPATAAGAAFALILLGAHPQLTLYSGLFVALWTLGPALQQAGYLNGDGPRSRRRTRAALSRWLLQGACCLAVAVALSAVELFPALEATRQATRAVGVSSEMDLKHALWVLLCSVGPSWSGWEDRGGLGILWLATACCAPLLGRGQVRFQAIIWVGLILFALGGAAVLQSLPGFSLFRLPSRMFLLAALPLALLAGSTVQSLFEGPALTPLQRRHCRKSLVLFVSAGALLASGLASIQYLSWTASKGQSANRASTFQDLLFALPTSAWVYWIFVLLAAPALFWLLGQRSAERPTWLSPPLAQRLWQGILLAELWIPTWTLVDVRPVEDIYRPSSCVRFLVGQDGDEAFSPWRVLDRGVPGQDHITPLNPGLALVSQIELVRGYNSLDVRRYREYLQVLAGIDTPLRPREGPFGFPILKTFAIKNRPLLDLLGVRFLLQPQALPLELSGCPLQITDESPEAYLVIAGGRQRLPPFVVYENPQVFPRAFVVTGAEPWPKGGGAMRVLKTTDLRRTALLENWPGPPVPAGVASLRPARIREYHPNHVVVDVSGLGPGFLVLADIWYPGWKCTVDGQAAALYRADYLFRATPLPEGAREVVFTFSPSSYSYGRLVSVVSLTLLILLLPGLLVKRKIAGHAS